MGPTVLWRNLSTTKGPPKSGGRCFVLMLSTRFGATFEQFSRESPRYGAFPKRSIPWGLGSEISTNSSRPHVNEATATRLRSGREIPRWYGGSSDIASRSQNMVHSLFQSFSHFHVLFALRIRAKMLWTQSGRLAFHNTSVCAPERLNAKRNVLGFRCGCRPQRPHALARHTPSRKNWIHGVRPRRSL